MVAGRLGGAEMSRREAAMDGRVPLHTLRADIDFGRAEAHTTFGRIGVKVWIYKGDVIEERRRAVEQAPEAAEPPAPRAPAAPAAAGAGPIEIPLPQAAAESPPATEAVPAPTPESPPPPEPAPESPPAAGPSPEAPAAEATE
jgi:small subunit ribosomal protein S3